MNKKPPTGSSGSAFPQTRWSILVGARSGDPRERERALQVVAEAYWKPVYKYLRYRWKRDHEDAADLTQEFLIRIIEKRFLDEFDPKQARLRTFLRTCLDRFVQNQDRDAARLKRGGGVEVLSLDFQTAQGELANIEPPDPRSLEDFFDREWARSFFGLVVEELEAHCREHGKPTHFRIFERYDLEDEERALTYERLAQDFGLRVTDVTNYLAYARREFRRIALEKLWAMTGSEEEFRLEARMLLGVNPS